MRNRYQYQRPRLPDGTTLIRPHIEVILSFGQAGPNARPTPEFEVLIDTGADHCLFDWSWASWMGFDPRQVGQRRDLTGIGGKTETYLVRGVELYVPALEWESSIDAYFLPFAKDVGGVLGHDEFLSHFSVTFHKGEYFEIVDERPAPVANLRPV